MFIITSVTTLLPLKPFTANHLNTNSISMFYTMSLAFSWIAEPSIGILLAQA